MFIKTIKYEELCHNFLLTVIKAIYANNIGKLCDMQLEVSNSASNLSSKQES